MAKRAGVLLSGCGVYDGSEIHEAVLTMLALDRAGAEIICVAPNADQMHVVNHAEGQPAEGESRNILVESARIARGKIKDAATVSASDVDALFIPGGFGAAKNLCTYAVDGPACTVNADVEQLVRDVHGAGKPICAVCIAPVLLAKVLGKDVGPTLTIGTDEGTAGHINEMGAGHEECPVRECVVDDKNKMVTTPAYMLAQSIGEAADGIQKAVQATLAMA